MDFWQFFSNVLAFQWATFQHFTSTIGKGLQAGVDATPFWGLITVNGSACTIELWMYLENYYKYWKNPLLAVFLTGMPLILSFLIWAKKNFFASDWTTKYTSMASGLHIAFFWRRMSTVIIMNGKVHIALRTTVIWTMIFCYKMKCLLLLLLFSLLSSLYHYNYYYY